MNKLESAIAAAIEEKFNDLKDEIQDDFDNHRPTYEAKMGKSEYQIYSLGLISGILAVYRATREVKNDEFQAWINHEQRDRFFNMIREFRESH